MPDEHYKGVGVEGDLDFPRTLRGQVQGIYNNIRVMSTKDGAVQCVPEGRR